jgi:hypothetical protein
VFGCVHEGKFRGGLIWRRKEREHRETGFGARKAKVEGIQRVLGLGSALEALYKLLPALLRKTGL